jgi:hypothetical protein
MREWMYRSTFFLNSALVGGEWSASRHVRSNSRETIQDTHWIGGSVGSTACLDTAEMIKVSYPAGNQTPAVPTLIHCYTNWATALLYKLFKKNIFLTYVIQWIQIWESPYGTWSGLLAWHSWRCINFLCSARRQFVLRNSTCLWPRQWGLRVSHCLTSHMFEPYRRWVFRRSVCRSQGFWYLPRESNFKA